MSTNGKQVRRIFKEECKRDAVNLVVVEGYSFTSASRAPNVIDQRFQATAPNKK